MSGFWRFSLISFLCGFILAGIVLGDDSASNSSQDPNDCWCANENCCPRLSECCCPLWTVRADYLYLQRTKPADKVLVADNADAPLLNANEFFLNFNSGWDVSLIRENVLGSCWSVEGLYSQVDGWNATRGVVTSRNGAWVQFVHVIGNGTDPSETSGTYHSELRNVELNCRRDIGRWGTFLIGYRYIDLRENLGIFRTILTNPPADVNYSIDATNYLNGVQVGLDCPLYTQGRWTIKGLIKVGGFNDSASNRVAIRQASGNYDSAANVNHLATLEEIDFTALYALNSHWSIRCGYELLWLQGVALGSAQVAVSDPLYSTATVDAGGNPFFHGGVFGLECKY